jgi:predicted RNase H-like HicB family nuclease
MTLKAVIHEDETGGFWAEVPSLPGCVTQGESLAEIKMNIREAVEAGLEAAEPDPTLEESGHIFEVAI